MYFPIHVRILTTCLFFLLSSNVFCSDLKCPYCGNNLYSKYEYKFSGSERLELFHCLGYEHEIWLSDGMQRLFSEWVEDILEKLDD